MKRLTFEQILALYPDLLTFNMLDLRTRKGRYAALKDLAGAYILFCHDSGKYYVGSSKVLANRMGWYIPTDANYKAKISSLILRAIFKYGLSSFTLLVQPIENPSRESLLELEQKLMDALLPEYNILSLAGSALGFTHTKEARSKISKAKQGENNPMFGRRGEDSPRFGSGKSLYVYSSDKLELISTYRSLRQAETAMQSDMRTLTAFANSQKIFRNKFILSFKPLETKE